MHTPLLRTADEGITMAVVGDVYRFMALGSETDGKYAVWEAIIPPGGGPPPHVHSREQEGFFVIEGKVTFHLGNGKIVAGPGMFVNMPPGVPHWFKNESDKPARMTITVAPTGLELMFIEVGTPLAPGSTTAQPPNPVEIEKMLGVMAHYGVEILAKAEH